MRISVTSLSTTTTAHTRSTGMGEELHGWVGEARNEFKRIHTNLNEDDVSHGTAPDGRNWSLK